MGLLWRGWKDGSILQAGVLPPLPSPIHQAPVSSTGNVAVQAITAPLSGRAAKVTLVYTLNTNKVAGLRQRSQRERRSGGRWTFGEALCSTGEASPNVSLLWLREQTGTGLAVRPPASSRRYPLCTGLQPCQ